MSLKPTAAAPTGAGVKPAFAANDPAFDPWVAFAIHTSSEPTTQTKVLRLVDGKLVKKASAATKTGAVGVTNVADAGAFAAVLQSLGKDQAITYGLPKKGPCHYYSRQTYGRLNATKQAAGTTRTQDAYEFADGPGVFMLDYDPRRGLPALTPTELRATIAAVLPELETCASVQWKSSSSCIFDADGNELAGVRGQRIYVLVQDARDIPRAGAVLSARLWLAGHGYYEVSAAGSKLERCTVDTSVWQANRLDFAAGADCKSGLVQRRGEPEVHNGPLLDTAAALPDLSAEELATLARMKAEAKAAIAAEARAVRDQYVTTEAEKAVAALPDADGLTDEDRQGALVAARARIRRAVEGDVLAGEWTVQVIGDNGEPQPVTVAALLAKREKFDGRRTLDPLEPDYGDGRAVGYLRLPRGHPCLYAHAHGGRTFRLMNAPHRIEHMRGNTQTTTDETLRYLRGADVLFDRGSEMVYVDDVGLHPTNGAALNYAIARHVQYVQAVPRGTGKQKRMVDQPIDPPPAVLQQIAAIERGLKRIRAAVTAPVMAPGGRIVQQYGHDAGTGLYVLADCSAVKVPEYVSEGDALQALGVLWHPFREFDCASNLDRGVLLAAILTAIERPALPTAPGFAMDAPLQGSGKTYLAQCLAALAQGSLRAVDPPVDDETEIRKRLLSAALAAPPVVIWDNLMGTLCSPALAAFLTSETYTDRVLGESRIATGETRALFLVTGNNVQLAGDMPRRVLRCRLDAHSENPETRVFHDNPRSDILRRRFELVQAGLTLMCGHRQSGWKPTSTTASFEVWDSLVRQCVAWVASLRPDQFQDPGDAFTASKADDPEREELAELLDGLVAALDVGALAANDGWFTAADVVEAIDNPGSKEAVCLRRTLQPLCAHGLSPKAIGRVLTFRKDRQLGGRCLRARASRNRPTVFRVDCMVV